MMKTYFTREANAEDCGLIASLIDITPQEGGIVMNFERAPNFFMGTHIATTDPDVWLCCYKDEREIAGVFSLGARKVYVNGEMQNIRYANDLRIHPGHRGRSLTKIFRQVKQILQPQEWMQTVILAENESSLKTVGSGRAGLPTYHPYGEIQTHMLYVHASKPSLSNGLHIRRALVSDVTEMQEFFEREAPKKQCYPYFNFHDLVAGSDYFNGLSISDYFLAFDEDELVGITGVWNQKDFKQTRFIEYRGKMRWLRHVNNAASHIFGGIQLPKPGETLNYLHLHCLLVKNNDDRIFKALLRDIYNAFCGSNISTIVSGLSIDDPLMPAFDAYRKQTLRSKHFLVSYDYDPRPELEQDRILYLDIARL